MHRKVTVLELEGLVINNLIKSYRISECSSNKKLRSLKVSAKTVNDEDIETECMDQERIGRIIAILASYQKWSRLNFNLGESKK